MGMEIQIIGSLYMELLRSLHNYVILFLLIARLLNRAS